jgi:outer membrane protein assembly factor BamB
MIKINMIENVSHIQILNKNILIGVDTNTNHGLVCHGNEIIKIISGKEKERFSQKYFSFITFGNGIIYYENEGEPIFFTDFKRIEQITPKNHYFNSLQNRSNSNNVLIAESDNNFNKTYYVFSIYSKKKKLSKFSDLILNDSFICSTKNTVELFSTGTMIMCWRYQCDEGIQLDRRNKLFSDENVVYVPLKGGTLVSIDKQTGDVKWEWKGGLDYVSYGENGDFIYVHSGDKIIIVSKVNGQVKNVINYSDYEELNSFRSNGLIWCFDSLIVVRNSGSGELVIFNRKTFKVLGREIVDEFGIGESKNRIQFVDNYLYVLSTSSTLHIYQLENELS